MAIPKLAAAVLVMTALGAGAQAPAQTATAPAAAARPTGAGLAIPELLERLSREGYRDVSGVERKSDKLYKVNARDAQGRRLELSVDARTAEVLASEEEDEDD
jgi:Peptidase propeptide and YPEB domain